MSKRVAILTGGIGGAKLVEGASRVLGAQGLTAIVNTGDDFRHFGLPVSPDIDTLLYTLSGKANRSVGWGREGETWNFMAAMRSLGAEDWFNLGDGDLALHVLRGALLNAGQTLSQVVARFAQEWELPLQVLPMSDDPVSTWVDSDAGPLPFQRYFVEQACRPAVRNIRFEGAQKAVPAPGVEAAIMEADAVLIAPSNPWLSIDPMLAIPALRTALIETRAPVIAVSPLVEGKAVKGPTAKIMAELGLEISNAEIAVHYDELVDGFVVHGDDAVPDYVQAARTDTLMTTVQDKERVARAALHLAEECAA